MKKYSIRIFSVFFLFAFAEKADASHSMGADLTYRCLGGNIYELTLSFYRDCVGVPADDSAYIDASSSCQGLYYVYLLRVPGTGQEITPLCPSAISTCSGGTFTGIQEYVYKRTVILPGVCTDWTFSYNQCCRNNAITNITTPGSWQMYVYATLNNVITPCNNSPTFSNKPVPFVCMGQQFCFNHGAFDVDGDSLVYSLITPWDSPGLPISYLGGFSATNPLSSSPAVSFNPLTGDICMTPTALQVTVMAVLVREYRNGVLIGEVERDIQVTVISCTNQVPALTGMNGTNNFSASTCAGNQICFTINSTDADAAQNTFVSWDNSIPGASFTVNAGSRESAVFCWTPTLADVNSSPNCFTVTVRDDNCPVWGSQTFSYCINVESIQVNVPDQTIGCNATANLTASASGGSGSYSYSWNTGATTQSISAGPGTYTVTVSNGICTATATSTVSQTSSVSSSAVSSDVTCNGGNDGSATVTASGGTAPFSYSWSPSGGTGATASNLSAGNYVVTVTDAMGCGSSSNVTIAEPTLLTASVVSSNVLCNGGSDGSASVTAANGTPGYTYSWSPSGGTASTANSLGAGTYTVTVTDANGCTATANSTINEPLQLTASANSTPALCNGSADGTATVIAGNGTPGYSYSWSPGGNVSAGATGLAAGTYSVTVTDANGCTATATATVTEPLLLTAAATASPVLCNGGTDGAAAVNAADGTPGYTYAWSPSGGTGSNATGLAAGNYTVTVTDANGCTATANAIVQEPMLLTATVSSTNVLCNGGNDGSAAVVANDGTPGYQYSWNPSGGTGSTANSLAAGSYTVTVTDANGCTAAATTTVSEPSQLTAIASATPVLCSGGTDGMASVNAMAGTPGYTYLWSSGGSGAAENSLPAGTYTVLVTDANGCTATASASVTEPFPLTATAVATPALCNGNADGTATVTANDGTPGYTYSWSPSGGNAVTATGLAAGNYTITITDANGCVTSASVAVTEPLVLNATAIGTPVLCNGGTDGTATVTAADGTPGYTYAWSPSGGSAANATGLAAGNYIVTVTDANGCTTSAGISIAEPTLLTTSAISTDALCNGASDGTVAVIAQNGTPGYTYSWYPAGGSSANGTGLPAGNYTVTVTDANGCTSTATTIISEPLPLTATAVSTAVLCNGGTDGTATVSAGDGTPGYAYSWSPTGGTGAAETGLPAGTYNVIVTDANGCSVTASTTVTEPLQLIASATSASVLCNGGNDGSATVVAYDGTPGYAYSWFPSGGTGPVENLLAAGTYSVTVTDANGCSTTTVATVTEPPLLTAATTSTAALCNGSSDGSAMVTAVDGTPGYSYSWSSGGTGPAENGLTAGVYVVTVTDANGCTTVASTFVTEPTLLTATATASPVFCNGGSDGTATVSAIDGTPGYTYLWTQTGGIASTETGLAAGSYTVLVTDANGCTASVNAAVTEPAPVTASASATPCLCNGSADGSVSAVANGGVGAYVYSWTPGGAITATVNNLPGGSYTVTVTDSNGCATSSVALVNEPALVALSMSSAPALCHGDSSGIANATASGGTGAYTYSWFPAGGNSASTSGITAGNYAVTVTDANGCMAVDSVFVSEPPAITLYTGSTPAICGSSNGSANVTVSGGAAPYLYLWSPAGGSSSTAANISAGAYTVTITDANGCTAAAIENVLNTGGPAVTAAISSVVSCHGGSDGSAGVNVSNGTPPYSYLWSPTGGTGSTASGLPAGNYSVTVTDANGCISSDNVVIPEPGPLAIQTSSTDALCDGSADGTASVIAAGGTGPYSYAWWPGGSTSSTATSLAAGLYSVTITDANGCTAAATATVQQAPALLLALSSVPALCNGSATGNAWVNVTGGTSGYSYLWNPSGSTSQNAANLTAGNYSVLVTDANGCTSTGTVNVTQPPPINLSTSTTPATCGTSNGSATVSASGGIAPYSYLWSPAGGTNGTAPNLPAGTFTIQVTDANGCTANSQANVSNAGGPVAAANVLSNVSCFGGNNGSAEVNVSSGNPPFNYVWSPAGGNSTQATGLIAGNYSIIISDAIGCVTVANVTITEPPELVLNLSSTAATCGDANGTAAATASGGTGSLTYLWSPYGGINATAAGLTGGIYSVLVTDANGCSTGASTTVINSGGAAVTLQSYSNITCFGGSDGSAAVVVSGGAPPYSYSWLPTGDSTAAIANIPAGNYSVTVTDSVGCVSNITVSLSEPPAISIQMNMSSAGCNGAADGSAQAAISGGVAPYAYSWSPVAGTDSILANVAAGYYTVTVTDHNGCADSSSIAVTSPSSVAASIVSTGITCFGLTDGSVAVNITSGTGPFSFAWVPNVGSSSFAENLPPGNYNVTITDANGCMSVVSALVYEPPLLAVSVSADATLCIEQDTVIWANATGGTQPYTYLWDNGFTTDSQFVSPQASASYTVEVTDANGCTLAPQTILVAVNPPLNVAAAATPEICEGDPANISAIAGGGNGGPYSFSWNNGAILTNGTVVYPASDSTFTVIVSDGCSPPVQAAVYINVNPAPEVNFIPQLIEGCTPVLAAFSNNALVPPGSLYAWNLGDGTTSSDHEIAHTYDEPGHYTVSLVVTTPDGCVDELTVVNAVEVFSLPTAGFEMSSNEVTILTPSIDFFDRSHDADMWNWNFGDHNSSNEADPVHQYADTGMYTIRLIVENANGCLDTTYGTLRIKGDFTVFIPNAFTPNGDHSNDFFTADGIGWKDFEMFIIDRWGLEIYHTTSRDLPWNGTFYHDGRECQSDVYEYLILIHDENDRLHKFIGHVSLVN